jgi:hypothetical protein
MSNEAKVSGFYDHLAGADIDGDHAGCLESDDVGWQGWRGLQLRSLANSGVVSREVGRRWGGDVEDGQVWPLLDVRKKS